MSKKRVATAVTVSLGVPILLAVLLLGAPKATAQENSHMPVDVVRVNPARCLEVGDFSGFTDTIRVPSGSLVILQQSWGVKRPHHARAFLRSTERVVTLAGEPIDNEVDYWASELGEWQSPDYGRVLLKYWIYPAIGPLPDGSSLEVHWEYTALRDFTDGFFSFPEGEHREFDCTIIWGP